jgi:TolB-like protein
MSFFEELKRRNVVRVGIAYVVASWLLLQLTEVLTELLDVSADVGKIVIILLIVGFIPALIFAWAFELTPEGIKRDHEVDRNTSITPQTGRKLDFFIIAVLVIALGYFVYDEIQDKEEQAAAVAEAVAEAETAVQAAPPVSAEPSIAVLPFADMSAEGDQAYFSDGISEELLNLLVRVDGLKVASRTSSFAYKGSNQSIADIASELKVDHVLEGSVRKADNRVRITAQLIDTQTDRHLWSDTYDRELDDIFAIQDEIANAIVSALQAELGVLPEGAGVTVETATENLDAYELYLKGRGLFIARQNLDESIAAFEEAVALDPAFVRAWEGLAAVYSVAESWGITDRDYSAMSVEAAQRALDLDPDLSLPWAVIGTEIFDDGDALKGMEYIDKAIANDPRNGTALLWRSLLWSTAGFFDKAIADAEACLTLDSAQANCRRHLAIHYYLNGNEDRGLELFTEGVEIGFAGSNGGFVGHFVRNDNRVAAALFLWFNRDNDKGFPATEILDAITYPERDHSKGVEKLLLYLESNDLDIEGAGNNLLLVHLGAYQHVRLSQFSNNWIWLQDSLGFRNSRYFKPLIREMGLPEFWRVHGFPPMCRPLDEGDFECD